MNNFTDFIIKNSDDIYIFFEIFNQIKPRKILDVGVFLKRIGAISRNVMEYEIEDNVIMDGIDLFPEVRCGVYKQIYNHLFEIGGFSFQSDYDLIFLIRIDKFMNTEQMNELWKYAASYCKYAITTKYPEMEAHLQQTSVDFIHRTLNSGESNFELIIFQS